MALDGVTSFLRLKDVTVTCKRKRRSLSIGGSSLVQWRKVGRNWWLQMCFRRLLCVRIEIDQLQCVNCWVINHCLSVSCTKINHSRCALVIWSSLQLTSKQWIITQQFTAGADLFLKYKRIVGKPNFSDQFKKIVKRYIRVGYNFDIMRQSACLVLNPIKAYCYGFLFNCTPVGQASDSMTTLT